MGNWSNITKNFVTLMESELLGKLSISYKRYTGAIDLERRSAVPATLFHGAYGLGFGGHDPETEWVSHEGTNAHVRLQLCYELNAFDTVESYDKAMDDLDIVIRKRLDPTTFQDQIPGLSNITHLRTSALTFIGRGDAQSFGVVEVEFLCLTVDLSQ